MPISAQVDVAQGNILTTTYTYTQSDQQASSYVNDLTELKALLQTHSSMGQPTATGGDGQGPRHFIIQGNISGSVPVNGRNNTALFRQFKLDYTEMTLAGMLSLTFKNLHLDGEGVIDGYALHTKNVPVLMSSMCIGGYSKPNALVGGKFNGGLTGGGAMRIRVADYSAVAELTGGGHLQNVSVFDCCRGFRIQDCVGCVVKDCEAHTISDNAFYLAAGSYSHTSGCTNCKFQNCTATMVGQTCFLIIGGNDGGNNGSNTNTVKDCKARGSIGAGVGIYNTTANVDILNTSFTNVNYPASHSPVNGWGGGVDDFNGAIIGVAQNAAANNAIQTEATAAAGNGTAHAAPKVTVTNCSSYILVAGGADGDQLLSDIPSWSALAGGDSIYGYYSNAAAPTSAGGDGLLMDLTTNNFEKELYDLMKGDTTSKSGDVADTLYTSSGTQGGVLFVSGHPDTVIATVTSGVGDPIISPLYGASFQLPCDSKNYLLFDNQDMDQRLIINTKLHILSEGERQEIQEYCNKVWNRDCNVLSYMKYISVFWDGEWTSYNMDTFKQTKNPSNKALDNLKLEGGIQLETSKTNRVISWYNKTEDTESVELSWQTQKHGKITVNLEKYTDREIRNGIRMHGMGIRKDNSFGALVACADFKKLLAKKPLSIPPIQNNYSHNFVCQTGHIQYHDGLIVRSLLQKPGALTHLLK